MSRFPSYAALAGALVCSLFVACGADSNRDDRNSRPTTKPDGGSSGIPQTVAAKCSKPDAGTETDGGVDPVPEVNDAGEACTCPEGYLLDEKLCRFINYCTLAENGGCDPNATCTPAINSRTCECKSGYEGNGETCTAMQNNPCETNNGGCSANATCAVEGGEAVCTCKSGYTGNGKTCTPNQTNPCETNNGGCSVNATCTASGGQAVCTCKAGYTGNGKTCTKTTPPSKFYNACTDKAQCDANQLCIFYADDTGVCMNTCSSNFDCPQHLGPSECNVTVDSSDVCTLLCELAAPTCPSTSVCDAYNGMELCLP